jgi:hypothetical protein
VGVAQNHRDVRVTHQLAQGVEIDTRLNQPARKIVAPMSPET